MVGVSQQRYAIVLAAVLSAVITPVCPTIDFQSHAPTVMLGTTNAQLKIVNNQQIIGWGDRSIVETFGRDVMSTWAEGYTNGSVISQTGGTRQPPLELVQANSNALVVLSGPIVTTSNTIVYGLRVNSNALRYGDRVNSGAIAALPLLLRTQSNAFAYGIKNNSNAIIATVRNMAVPVADSIDGTQFVKYCTNHYVFHNNGNAWTARGWVRFNNGFTVMPRASVIMDTLTTVSGGFDLRDTGTLILNNDLYLAHNVTLTNGGNIKGESSMSSGGQANTIFMGGDLTLASTTYARTLHITGDWSNSGTSGDLVIDGCGHTLDIQDRAQIFVDTNVTLTLRNMTIKTGPKSLNNPAIQLASHGSKLALDNVVFDLGADLHFITGQIFIHDEVAVTGTSAFVYQSPRPSYITSGATWSFEQGTTFSVAPSTYTDCPYTVNSTYTNNNFIVLADQSSALSLNSCSLKTTYTGLRITKGMLMFDNRVAVDTSAGVALNTTTPLTAISTLSTAANPYGVAWSPDGRFLALIFFNSPYGLQIYRFNPNGDPTKVGGLAATGTQPYSVAWSPDGRFIVVTNKGSNGIQVYRFNGSSTPSPVGGLVVTGSGPQYTAWSPDGKFLATINFNVPSLQLSRFDGVSAPVLVGSAVAISGTQPTSIFWSPDSRYLVTAVYQSHVMRVYRFNGGTSTPVLVSSLGTDTYPWYAAFSPDGRYVALSAYLSSSLGVYNFTGRGTLSLIGGGTTSLGARSQFCSWSPDGRYIVIIAFDPTNILQLYQFDGTNKPAIIGSTVTIGATPRCVVWSPDGQYIAAVCADASQLVTFRCNFVSTPVAQQAFTNGLLFGDKAKGTAYDADVRVLGRGTVAVKGMVRDDSA